MGVRVSVKFKTHTDDRLIPKGFLVREHDEEALDPAIRVTGCRWVARHEEIHSPCEWHSWHRSYPAAVLAARIHAGQPCIGTEGRRKRRAR